MRLDGVARLIWTLGLFAYLAHVAAAFHFYHGWSHARAVADTARQTRELIGVDFAGGVWFNYAFTLLWIADSGAWWLLGSSRYRRRPRWVHVAVHGSFLFMIVNGAILFAAGPTRWITAAACLALGAIWLRSCRVTSGNPRD